MAADPTAPTAAAALRYSLPPVRLPAEDILFCVDVDLKASAEMKSAAAASASTPSSSSASTASPPPPPPRKPLAPSDAVARLQGRDIVRRGGQRKSHFLFSFPGLLAPAASAGRVGELADLGTKNPLLYLEFPQGAACLQGRMKLFGTHVYPKNKYLTLQMTRSAKGVVCEDVFESLDCMPGQ